MIRYTVQRHVDTDAVYVLEWKGGGAVTGVSGPIATTPAANLAGYEFSTSLAAWANGSAWDDPTVTTVTPDPPAVYAFLRAPARN